MYSYTYHSLWVVLDLHGYLETIYYFLEPPASSITKPGCRDDVDDRLLQITCSNLLVTCTWMCCVFVSKKDWSLQCRWQIVANGTIQPFNRLKFIIGLNVVFSLSEQYNRYINKETQVYKWK